MPNIFINANTVIGVHFINLLYYDVNNNNYVIEL